MDLASIFKAADSISSVGIMLAIIYAFVSGKIVFPREVKAEQEISDRLLAERDQWQRVALQAMNLGEQTIQVAKISKRVDQ